MPLRKENRLSNENVRVSMRMSNTLGGWGRGQILGRESSKASHLIGENKSLHVMDRRVDRMYRLYE